MVGGVGHDRRAGGLRQHACAGPRACTHAGCARACAGTRRPRACAGTRRPRASTGPGTCRCTRPRACTGAHRLRWRQHRLRHGPCSQPATRGGRAQLG